MAKFLAHKEFNKNKFLVQGIFCCVTLAMLITRYFSFYTFKGSDDLHYAFLSSSVLQGSYDMFFANDIYSGRAVVVFYQALWFKLFGINDLSMCMPSLSVLIILAYLVCFKCGLQKNIQTVLLGSSLVYFNPVVTRATLGNLPDVYIALIALLVFILIKKNTAQLSIKQNIVWGIIIALLLTAGLFVKESIVLIYAGTAALLLYYRKYISRHFVFALATALCVGTAGYLFFYYFNTGNLFYHFVQIKNSAYFNRCSYDCLPETYLLKRLTITVPYEAVVANAWPLLLALPVLLTYRQYKDPHNRFWKISFVSLLILALYFPFSIAPYIPLCHDMRQFFFLFPFAAILYLAGINDAELPGKPAQAINIAGSVVFAIATLVCCFFTAFNKWGILCSGMLALSFIVSTFSGKKIQQVILYFMIPFILWLSTAYSIFKEPHQGYRELKTMQGILNQETNFVTNTYYFLNNDTKMHFALISQFDTTKQFLNLDTVQHGFKPFIAWQLKKAATRPSIFQKGWLVVSEDYRENMNVASIGSIDRLLAQMQCYRKINKISVYYLTSEDAIKKIMNIINVKTSDNGCY